MRFDAFQSVALRPACGPLGSPPPLPPRRFRRELRFLPAAIPAPLAQNGSSSRRLSSSSERFRLLSAHRLYACASPAAFLGVAVPSSRCQSPAALRAASQSHPPSVLDVSHVLDGLLRLRPRGFVSPHNHVQGFSLQGVAPPTQPSRLVDVSCPLVVVPVPLPEVSHRRRIPGPRPQGFRPRGNPLSLPWRLSRRLGAIPS